MTDQPTPVEELAVTMIELTKLDASPTQPRKRFDEEKYEQLTASMREHGFTLSALTVRPREGDRFEIVTGERRWRAAKAAGIAKAPCFVRSLSDEQVIEQQLIENIQREDLTPIEEAEAYKKILSLRDSAGNLVYTVQSLSKRLGRPERTIFERLNLCKLDSKTRGDVEAGRLPMMTALLIGKIPDATQRERFASLVMHPQKEEGPLSVRRAEELMHREFIRDLRLAPFDRDDPDLLEIETVDGVRVAGGACTDCPLRAGVAQAGVIAREKQSICMNPACYERKAAAEWTKWQTENTKPEKKRIALSEPQCRKLFAFGNQISPESGLVDLADHPDGGDLKPGEASPGTWRTLTTGADIQVFVARDRFGKVRELVKRDMAIEAARTINNHGKIFKTTQREKTKPDATRKEEEKKKAVDREKDQAVLEAIFEGIRRDAKISATPRVEFFLAYLVDRELSSINATPEFLKRYHLPIGGSSLKQLEKLDAANLIAILVDLIISEGGYCTDVHDADGKWLKTIFDIDHKSIAKQLITQNSKSEKKERPKKSQLKGGPVGDARKKKAAALKAERSSKK